MFEAPLWPNLECPEPADHTSTGKGKQRRNVCTVLGALSPGGSLDQVSGYSLHMALSSIRISSCNGR
jgi:hypothetical protein